MTTFDVSTLDALAEQAGAYTLAVWGAADGDAWPQVTAEALTGFVIQGEQIGRTFGMAVEPRDGDPVLPVEVVEGRNPGWRRPPEGFVQRSGEAPEPDVVLRYDQRVDELLERLTLAARTIAAGDVEDAEGRVERLARDETVQAAQRGYQDGLRLHAALDAVDDEALRRAVAVAGDRNVPRTSSATIRGYRRGVNPDCCELCFWLWKEGYVYPVEQPMHRHTGCRCVPVPTTDPPGRWALSDRELRLLAVLYDRHAGGEERER
ncbi:hypothetical protein [Dermacoccus nishinomiyaensis]|uniref:hypothetical protein n=1 Tax=Dermacoccus nishinomiyaensis TaxID=1274 RepID=UPI00248E2C19|nr:hypothetical protein [Dermacoccus nishinomiyaensis]